MYSVAIIIVILLYRDHGRDKSFKIRNTTEHLKPETHPCNASGGSEVTDVNLLF